MCFDANYRVQQLRGMGLGVMGSFIEESGPQTSTLPSIDDVSLVKMSYGSMEQSNADNRYRLFPIILTRSAYGELAASHSEGSSNVKCGTHSICRLIPPQTTNSRDFSSSTRSSFGLLPLDQMEG